MTKRKTALLQLMYNIHNCEELDLSSRVFIVCEISKLMKQEKQDLIDAFDEGSNATSWDSFEEAYDITPSKEEYFNQTFENER